MAEINGETSDGYHTFNELYAHRHELFVALCRTLSLVRSDVWKSKTHSDGSRYEGWFVMGIGKKHGKQITYHLPEKYWLRCDFAEELLNAPDFDGHTSNDVLDRLSSLVVG